MRILRSAFVAVVGVLAILVTVAASAPAQGNYTSPFLTAGSGLTLNYSSGTVFSGGTAEAITGATLTLTTNETNCSAPAYANCNIVYWHTGASLSTSTTLATAAASGNVIVGFVTTTAGGAINVITHANAIIPTPAGATTFSGATQIIPITVTDCGSSASCASPTSPTSGFVVVGATAFSASSTLTLTGLPFTSATTFACAFSDPSHAYTWTTVNVSGASVTVTAGTSNSDTWAWSCTGH